MSVSNAFWLANLSGPYQHNGLGLYGPTYVSNAFRLATLSGHSQIYTSRKRSTLSIQGVFRLS